MKRDDSDFKWLVIALLGMFSVVGVVIVVSLLAEKCL